jgi:hypothetical protein
MFQAKEFCGEWRGFYGGAYYYVQDNGYCISMAISVNLLDAIVRI